MKNVIIAVSVLVVLFFTASCNKENIEPPHHCHTGTSTNDTVITNTYDTTVVNNNNGASAVDTNTLWVGSVKVPSITYDPQNGNTIGNLTVGATYWGLDAIPANCSSNAAVQCDPVSITITGMVQIGSTYQYTYTEGSDLATLYPTKKCWLPAGNAGGPMKGDIAGALGPGLGAFVIISIHY